MTANSSEKNNNHEDNADPESVTERSDDEIARELRQWPPESANSSEKTDNHEDNTDPESVTEMGESPMKSVVKHELLREWMPESSDIDEQPFSETFSVGDTVTVQLDSSETDTFDTIDGVVTKPTPTDDTLYIADDADNRYKLEERIDSETGDTQLTVLETGGRIPSLIDTDAFVIRHSDTELSDDALDEVVSTQSDGADTSTTTDDKSESSNSETESQIYEDYGNNRSKIVTSESEPTDSTECRRPESRRLESHPSMLVTPEAQDALSTDEIEAIARSRCNSDSTNDTDVDVDADADSDSGTYGKHSRGATTNVVSGAKTSVPDTDPETTVDVDLDDETVAVESADVADEEAELDETDEQVIDRLKRIHRESQDSISEYVNAESLVEAQEDSQDQDQDQDQLAESSSDSDTDTVITSEEDALSDTVSISEPMWTGSVRQEDTWKLVPSSEFVQSIDVSIEDKTINIDINTMQAAEACLSDTISISRSSDDDE